MVPYWAPLNKANDAQIAVSNFIQTRLALGPSLMVSVVLFYEREFMSMLYGLPDQAVLADPWTLTVLGENANHHGGTSAGWAGNTHL